ncbi:MAG: TonB-dependent receptor [Bacteroidales bacterium]|nr:TonB-dependent receptor [Bacteroidales bacterium]
MEKVHLIFKNLQTLRALLLLMLILTLCPYASYAQTGVRGKITDTKGEPVVGAVVLVKGTNTYASSDLGGNYSLSAKAGNVLEFSYLGMETQEVEYKGQQVLNVVLKEVASALDEIIVVGYGTTQRASLTGSVTQIKGSELLKSPATNISSVLGGRVAGVSSVQESGQPGSDFAGLRIRGSRAGVAYIVDGMPRSINDIDPNDVETISILKDASSAAVYGLQSAGGVVIITTKQGRVGESKISYKGSMGASMNVDYPEFLDGPGYAYWYNKATELDGGAPIFTQEQVAKMLNDDPSDGWGNTNWIKETFGMGITSQHNVTANGGTDKIKYFASLGYLEQKGNIENFDFYRYNLRSNIDAKIANNLTLTLGIAGSISDTRSPGYAAGGSMAAGVSSPAWLSVAEQAAYAHPYLPMEIDGIPVASRNAYNNAVNPVAAASLSGNNKSVTNSIQTNITLKWDLPWVKGLNMKFTGGFDHSGSVSKNFSTPYQVWLETVPNSTTNDISYGLVTDARNQVDRTLGEGYSQWRRLVSQTSINYANVFGKHNVDAMVLMESRDYKSNRFAAYGKGFYFVELPELNMARVPSDNPISGSSDANRSLGFVGRVKYDYDNRYLAELSARYDGSYKFAGNVPGKRWGLFPSLSLGWRLSNEDFFNVDFIDNLKIRGSVGVLGSDPISPYAFLSTMSFIGGSNPTPQVIFNGQQQNALMTTAVANPNLTWEKMIAYNFGFDATLWSRMLGIEFDVFYNYTWDILGAQSAMPGSMGGYYTTYINNNSVDSKGFDLMLTHDNRVGDFYYGAKLNVSYAKTRYIKYQDSPNTPDYAKRTGKSPWATPVMVAEGLFQSEEEIDNSPYIQGARPRPGDIKYADLNGDGIISYAQDRALRGKPNRPELTAGLDIYGGWKGFDFAMLFTAGALHEISLTGTYYNYNDDNTIFTKPFKAGSNAPRFLVEQAWRPDNTAGTYPRLSVNAPNTNNAYASTFWYKDGKYVRMKSAQLGYTIPRKITQKIGSDNIRVYVEGTNLFTLSGLPQGIDPERPGVTNGYYPQQRTIMGGITISF